MQHGYEPAKKTLSNSPAEVFSVQTGKHLRATTAGRDLTQVP